MINNDRANNERGKTRFTTALCGNGTRILSASDRGGWSMKEGQGAALDPAGLCPASAKGQKPL
ncbi:MAG TPA: hypothetical protein VGH36_01240 [Acetobacteraceae bacterium]|jgi:hypothetical protein